MDVLPILGAFVGGIGGGIFASRMVRMQLDKFQKELKDFAVRIDKIQQDVKELQDEEAAWKVKWGAPLQASINALSAKLEALGSVDNWSIRPTWRVSSAPSRRSLDTADKPRYVGTLASLIK